jgi:RNA polymerase sigma factor (sigma-70 family)
METAGANPSLELLLENERWVRRLARALVRDDDEADDVVQEAHIALWQRPPRNGARVQSWVGTVVRNLVRNRRRDEQRHASSLARNVVASAATATPEDLLARVETHRRLAGLVSNLEEPFRQTIILRYYEGLSAAAIARQAAVPAGTVRWRLKKGLDDLRRDLDERAGGRSVWLALLSPFSGTVDGPDAARVSPPLASAVGGFLWPMASGLAAVAVVLFSFVMTGAEDSTESTGGLGTRPEGQREQARALLAGRSPLPRFASPRAKNEPGKELAFEIPRWAMVDGLPPRRIRGVVTAGGRPVSRAEVRLLSGMLPFRDGFELRATTDSAGRYAFPPQPPTNFLLTVQSDEFRPEIAYVDLRKPAARAEAADAKEMNVELKSCSSRVRGTVMDQDGIPIPHAELIAGASFGRGGHSTTSAANGSYEICVPGWSGNPAPPTIVARADGYAAGEIVAVNDREQRLDFVLQPESIVSGIVICARDERTLPRAKVSLVLERQPGRTTPRPIETQAITDDDGRFELRNVGPGRYRVLVHHDDCALNEWYNPMPVARGQRITNLVLRARPVTLVEGMVVQDGHPVPWSAVWIGQTGQVGNTYAQTDGEGRFRMGLLEMVADNITVYPRGGTRVTPISPSNLTIQGPRLSAVVLQLPPLPGSGAASDRARDGRPGALLDGRLHFSGPAVETGP